MARTSRWTFPTLNLRPEIATAPLAVLLCLLALGVSSGCVESKLGKSPAAPEALRVPPGQVLIHQVQGVGAQIYVCQESKEDVRVFRWTFKAPEAQLRDHSGRVVGRHYAGPTWEGYDGSKVVGVVAARVDSTEADTIPWLLLSVTSASEHGFFGHTKSIQRINTSGGSAPAENCSEALAGKEVSVPYKAEYLFYGDVRR
jgi:hypothetical protein